jgi:hypothetical protein
MIISDIENARGDNPRTDIQQANIDLLAKKRKQLRKEK